mmetsp:Transcript_14748/g.29999  ORF Transcript_14748/g.29999 Transcript_14748/m.29999 type:complete len:245 (-) Transcript_14748:1483-2217(-)
MGPRKGNSVWAIRPKKRRRRKDGGGSVPEGPDDIGDSSPTAPNSALGEPGPDPAEGLASPSESSLGNGVAALEDRIRAHEGLLEVLRRENAELRDEIDGLKVERRQWEDKEEELRVMMEKALRLERAALEARLTDSIEHTPGHNDSRTRISRMEALAGFRMIPTDNPDIFTVRAEQPQLKRRVVFRIQFREAEGRADYDWEEISVEDGIEVPHYINLKDIDVVLEDAPLLIARVVTLVHTRPQV